MASTMQLEFSQAMSDFKTMFPDMESEVIEVSSPYQIDFLPILTLYTVFKYAD